ncbi:MAG TPA: transcriptional regulator NrdR [Candidatus Nanoarchaeia archaeon]|nr:transcriptional regulator NrdR [Candidatus Nanoarchaeia archaeon]
MKCPYCMHPEHKVMDKRETPDGKAIRRRRECLKCEKRFTTYERIEVIELVVVKKDGRREDFDRSKILSGLKKACEKRPVPIGRIEESVNSIEADLLKRDTTEITSKDIGEMLMKKLKKLDQVAYIRFASVYRNFKDPEDFEEEVKKLGK